MQVRKPVYIITTGEPGSRYYRILAAFTEKKPADTWVERRQGSGPHPLVIEIYDALDE